MFHQEASTSTDEPKNNRASTSLSDRAADYYFDGITTDCFGFPSCGK